MGKRYYCDYCDRSFKDAPTARKKHLTSLQHIKNKEDHYNLFKDPEKILEEESAKNSCLRFMNTGECLFGSSCRYSHYTPVMIQQLRAQIQAKGQAKHRICNPDPEIIVKEFFEDPIDPDEIEVEKNVNLWPRSAELENKLDLPPSLWPITYKDFTSPDFPDWGWK